MILLYKSPGTDQIPAELIKPGCRTIRSGIHKLINSIWNKEELPEQWKKSVIVPMYMKGDNTDCSNYRGIWISCWAVTSYMWVPCQGHQ